MKNKCFYVLLAATILLPCQLMADPVNPVNVIVNGDFEAGNTGFSSDYTYSPGNIWNPATYDIVSDPHSSHGLASSFGDHTTGDGLMMVINGSTSPGLTFWFQPVPVDPGAYYTLSFWVASWYPDSPALLDVLINGTSVGTISPPGGEDVGTWQQFTAYWTAGVSGSATIGINGLHTEYGGNDFALDDISFVDPPIRTPEPSTILLSAVGLFGFAFFRKRLN
jgi:hypothetical protein